MLHPQLRRWLDDTTLTDPIERGQARALQIMLLLIGAFGALLLALLLIALLGNLRGDVAIASILGSMGLVVTLILVVAASLALLRRGWFQAAVVLVAVTFTALHGITVYTSGLENQEVLLVYLLPLTLAGLLSSRRALPAVLLIACGGVWLTALTAPGAATGLPEFGAASTPPVTAFNFTLIAGIVGVFFAVFGNVLADALARALSRERELDELRRGLERTVGERTAELRTALSEVEARAEAQERLRREADEQRALVRSMSVPVLPVSGDTLVVPLVGDLDAQRIGDLQAHALGAVERSACRRMVLDITGVPVVDTQVAQGLFQTMQALRLLGAEAVLVGIRPEVAQALVSLGVDLGAVATFADLQSALQRGARPAR